MISGSAPLSSSSSTTCSCPCTTAMNRGVQSWNKKVHTQSFDEFMNTFQTNLSIHALYAWLNNFGITDYFYDNILDGGLLFYASSSSPLLLGWLFGQLPDCPFHSLSRAVHSAGIHDYYSSCFTILQYKSNIILADVYSHGTKSQLK